jgi:ubiquinone/menaquinone biosynthesis C-methylase UbiE
MKVELRERLRAFRARRLDYLRLGHDRLAAARHVVDTAPDLRGPALDVGTGKGLLVVSVDLDEGEQELARLLAEEAGVGSRIAFVRADAARLPYREGHFGCVAMMDVLHHLVDPAPVLHEMARVVQAGGLVVIADFDAEGFEVVSRVLRGEGREHTRTPATLSFAENLLSRSGFRCARRTRGQLHDVVVVVKEQCGAGGSRGPSLPR